jgi:hypothetical protein
MLEIPEIWIAGLPGGLPVLVSRYALQNKSGGGAKPL